MGFFLFRTCVWVILGVLSIWMPGVLDVVYGISNTIWSLLSGLVIWFLPEPYHTSLKGVVFFVSMSAEGADWLTGIIPYYGASAQSFLRFCIYGAGVVTLASVVYIGVWLIRKIHAGRRTRHSVGYGF